VILPLAFRSQPAGAEQQSGQSGEDHHIAYAIAVPEMLYVANQIWVRRVERARDDERAADRLRVAVGVLRLT
jgi:hypothetical protein